jgi:hypothetical protein
MVVFAGAPALAGPPKVVAEDLRTLPGGRALQVIVAQGEIQSNINQSMLAVAAGGGLLFALIDAAIEEERAKKAEAAITPLREALAGFDADALSRSTTAAIVEATPWLQPVSETFVRDSSVAGKSAYLDAAGADQVSFFEYSYDVAADFAAVRVKLLMQFANRAVPEVKGKAAKPERRVAERYLAYSQTVTTIVSLPSPSKEIEENALRWAADDAVLARAALTEAFHQVRRFAPRALALSEADLKVMKGKDRKRMALGGFGGRQQPDAEPGALIWGDEGFTYAATMAETQPAAPEQAAIVPTDGQSDGQPEAATEAATGDEAAAPDQTSAGLEASTSEGPPAEPTTPVTPMPDTPAPDALAPDTAAPDTPAPEAPVPEASAPAASDVEPASEPAAPAVP